MVVIGRWQCNPRTGAVWRYTFYRNHTVTLSLPHDDTVDANQRNAKFDVSLTGTWHIEGDDLVYTTEEKGPVPERTMRIRLSEFRNAQYFPDKDARWERM